MAPSGKKRGLEIKPPTNSKSVPIPPRIHVKPHHATPAPLGPILIKLSEQENASGVPSAIIPTPTQETIFKALIFVQHHPLYP